MEQVFDSQTPTPPSVDLHTLGDECARCARAGWHRAQYASNTATGESITVAEGYGEYEGFILVASGLLVDAPFSTGDGEFRSPTTQRTLHRAEEYPYMVA